MQKKWQIRIAPSLGGGFEGTPEQVWGISPYMGNYPINTLFFGLYGLPDFYELWKCKGQKYILWAGSDIRHLLAGYWLDDKGEIKIENGAMAKWINLNCKNYVENAVEANALKLLGITAKIVPSFLGNTDNFKPCYKWEHTPKFYSSVSGNDFKLYGWDKIEEIAKNNTDIEFYLYGNTKSWETNNKNVIVRGRVPKEKMNAEIRDMQGAIRMTEFDGCSEIIVKSVLMGQYPVSLIEYPGCLKPNKIRDIFGKTRANLEGRAWFLENLNNYPWNKYKNYD